MTFHDINGLRLHVERMRPQDRPPVATVVLVHGLPADSLASYYFTIAPPLAAAGLDVVMYDQRGHGRSARPDSGYQLERFIDDLEVLLDELGGPVHLVGNCFGGVVVFGLAARRPDLVTSIFAIESEPATPQWKVNMAASLAHGKTELVRAETLAEITDTHGAHMARLARTAARLLTSSCLVEELPASGEVFESEQFGGICCPVLVAYGANSEMVDRVGRIEKLLPDCRTVIVADQEHFVLSGAPEDTCALILDWLAEQGVPVSMGVSDGEVACFVNEPREVLPCPSS
jgi:pimeloyl-ACP methyl ester carboxylesterase